MQSQFEVREESADDAAILSNLSAAAFGPGRFTRAAYKVREGVSPTPKLCLTVWSDGRRRGGVRLTPVAIGEEKRALLLGPLVVDPAYAGKGYGRTLVTQGLERAMAEGFRLVVLVGDMPYYGRFGFRPLPPGRIAMPGPVDPERLLAIELAPGALEGAAGLMQALPG